MHSLSFIGEGTPGVMPSGDFPALRQDKAKKSKAHNASWQTSHPLQMEFGVQCMAMCMLMCILLLRSTSWISSGSALASDNSAGEKKSWAIRELHRGPAARLHEERVVLSRIDLRNCGNLQKWIKSRSSWLQRCSNHSESPCRGFRPYASAFGG